MKLPWHERLPEAAQDLEARLAARYPALHTLALDGRLHIKGSFPVINGAKEIDHFNVDVVLSPDHPSALPDVFETGGRIPRVLARHVSGNGSACIVMPDAYWLANEAGEVDLLQYLDGPVHNYFLGQAAVERGEPWPFGEWAHGGDGIVELYGRLLGRPEPARVRALLEAVLRPSVKAMRCPCGSGRRLRRCHRQLVQHLRRKIPPSVVTAALAQVGE